MKSMRLMPVFILFGVLAFALPAHAGCPGYHDQTAPDNASGCSRELDFPNFSNGLFLPSFSGADRPNSYYRALYNGVIAADATVHRNGTYSSFIGSFDHLWGDWYWSSNNPASSPKYTDLTATRLCQLVASLYGYDSAYAKPRYEVAYTADNADGRSNLLFDGTGWAYWPDDRSRFNLVNGSAKSEDNNAIHWITGLGCTTLQPPRQTFGSSQTIRPGESATLSFNANYYYLPSYGNPETCEAVNWTVPTVTSEECTWGPNCSDGTTPGVDDCSTHGDYQQTCGPVTRAVGSGTVTVSPTVTTTYEYNCTNVNGTTPASVTIAVVGTLQCTGQGNACTGPVSGENVCHQTTSGTQGTIGCDASGNPVCSVTTPPTPPPDTSCPTEPLTEPLTEPQTVLPVVSADGVCAATHYSCTVGTSANTVDGSNSWTWSCNSLDGGSTASCSELKNCNGSCGSDHNLSCDYTYIDSNGNGVVDVNEPVRYAASPSTLGGSAYTWRPSETGTDITGGFTLARTYVAGGVYQMRVAARGYNSSSCSSVTVGADCGASPTGTLTASPNRVKQGSTVTLAWGGVKGVHTGCFIVNAPSCSIPVPDDSCDVASAANQCTSPQVNTQTTFTLKCDGQTVDTATVDVIPNIVED